MLKIADISKQWRAAGTLNAELNLLGFADERTTLAKDGSVMQVLRVSGIDFESQDSASQQQQVHRLEAAQKAFGSGFHVYQYLFKTNRPEIPFASYGDPVVDTAIEQRRMLFEAKRDSLFQIEIFYVIVLEGGKAKSGLLSALKSGSFESIRAQVSSRAMNVLLRSEIQANAGRLDHKVMAFIHHLSDLMQVEILGQDEAFTFFRRLLNFDDWRIAGRPSPTQFLDYQVVNSDVEAERDHLRVADHYVRVLTMKEAIAETRPMVLNDLLKIPANFYAVLEWSPMSVAKAHKDVTAKRRHFNMTKKSAVQSMREEQTRERDEMIDESKQADLESLGECLRAIGEGQGMGGLSITIVPYGRDLAQLNRSVSELASVFSNARGVLFPETYNQLNALFAVFPGNSVHNLRKLPILESNHADLSFLFTIHTGDVRNEHLGIEYLAVLETDNGTPYFLNLHDGEVANTFICGIPGSGKTTLIKQMLLQIQERNESAIIHDPACEFVKLFYDPKRGDIILNPLDERSPYWGPSEELRKRAEAKAIAASLYQPTSDKKGEFFTETPQKIFAHLLTFGPTPQQLIAWMSDPAEIDRRVKGTELASILAPGAQQQRSGVLASLGLIADSLRMLPTKEQAKSTWSATEWAEKREGWIFITSKAAEREALRPLHSLWIDLLVLRLLNTPEPGQKKVWFVLDELASLQRLPQLHTAITENRKSKNPLVLGFQGKAQLEAIYGHMAEVMLSQPATKIFLKTTEPKAAEWVSKAIGQVEIERVKETHSDGARGHKTFTVDRQIEPLVMDSEISGLADRHAFLKLGNNVARFSFAYKDLPDIAPDFVPRTIHDDELSFDPKTLQPRRSSIAVETPAVLPEQPQPTPSPVVDIEAETYELPFGENLAAVHETETL